MDAGDGIDCGDEGRVKERPLRGGIARRLAEWGYVAVVYDFVQQALDPSSDLACVDLLEELLTWCGNLNNPIGSLCDPNNILLVGHSRGAKISSLVASKDPRVKALYLIDPVDVTVYTPLSPEFPSAASALESSSLNQQLPVAIVGSGSGSDPTRQPNHQRPLLLAHRERR